MADRKNYGGSIDGYFDNITNEEKFREKLEGLSTLDLIGLIGKIPSHVWESYDESFYELLFDRLGIWDYRAMRNKVLDDWGGEDSLEYKFHELQDNLDMYNKEMEELIKEVRKTRKTYERLMEVIGEQRLSVKVKDIVGGLDAEEEI